MCAKISVELLVKVENHLRLYRPKVPTCSLWKFGLLKNNRRHNQGEHFVCLQFDV